MPANEEASGTDCAPEMWAVMDAEDEGASEVSLTVNVNEPLEAPFVKKNV